MELPDQPVTLSAAQVQELHRQLATMRHDINNNLSLILAAIEMSRLKPEYQPRMMETLTQQPPRITEAMTKFSRAFDHAFGVARGAAEPGPTQP